jgi:hypothetical protein
VLVAAVLRPEKREDGELEMIRVAPEQLPDTVGLPVREAELAMERVFRDEAQDASLPAPPDDLCHLGRRRRMAVPPAACGRAGWRGDRTSHSASLPTFSLSDNP